MKHTWHTLQNGLKDFCAANGFDKVILGLSGGLDSALTAVLAADALGGKNVKAIMMKTRYTSDLSIKIAREIARLNGLDYQELDIEPLVTAETDFLQRAFSESVKGITAENLQARIRGQLLMAFSNQNGGLVLACGNKSEALTGYCTLYGDTCGGLMPIGNLYKTTVFELANGAMPKAGHCRKKSSRGRRQQNWRKDRKMKTRCRRIQFWTLFCGCLPTNKKHRKKPAPPDLPRQQSNRCAGL